MTQEFKAKQLWEAAQQRKVCKIKFRGEFFVRIVHPYGLCMTSHKKIVIVCWQEDGPDPGRPSIGYRNMLLENCQGIEILNRTFSVREDFNPDDPLYKDWVFHV